MEPRIIFNLVMQGLGLYHIAYALSLTVYPIFRVAGYPPNTTHTPTGEICGILFYLIFGGLLLFSAPWVSRRICGGTAS